MVNHNGSRGVKERSVIGALGFVSVDGYILGSDHAQYSTVWSLVVGTDGGYLFSWRPF